MDLNKMMNDTLAGLKEEGFVEAVVKKQIEKTVKDIVEDSFNSWSTFGKGLKDLVKEEMAINFDKLDLPSYNHMIINTIKEELEKAMHEDGVKQITEGLQSLLGTGKNDYKLSELVKEMVKQDLEDDLDKLDYEETKEVTVKVEEKYGNTYIYLDPEEDVKWYQCKYQIVLDKDGTASRVEINDKTFDNKVIMGGLYGLDRELFQIFTRKAKVVIDDYETYFGNPEYE